MKAALVDCKLSIIFRAEDLEHLTKFVHTVGEVPHVNHEVGVSDLCEGQVVVSHVWLGKSPTTLYQGEVEQSVMLFNQVLSKAIIV